MTRNSEQIQAIFNRIAPVYDQMNDGLSLGQHRIWKQMTVSWSGASGGQTGLDLCCGSGDLAQKLAQKIGPSGKVYGVDFSAQLLAVANSRSTPITIPTAPINWIEADVLALPFPENTFDCATMGYGLRNVVDISRSLEELHRVLKPGARGAILDFHRPYFEPLRQFQQLYLDYLVVPMAQQMGLKQEYAYINPSLERFPNGQQQVALAEAAGFTTATHYALAGGMMGVLVIEK
ncbi:MAG: bifunctional demethylmenaquinone methyltransferase/2-methoxy-6-polyprenyl-1,4-benzoquinol methylase UbiE [Microcoleaceae cyanobacterium]